MYQDMTLKELKKEIEDYVIDKEFFQKDGIDGEKIVTFNLLDVDVISRLIEDLKEKCSVYINGSCSVTCAKSALVITIYDLFCSRSFRIYYEKEKTNKEKYVKIKNIRFSLTQSPKMDFEFHCLNDTRIRDVVEKLFEIV